MRLDDERQSENVEDRRGISVKRAVAGGGIGTILLVLVALYFGVDPRTILTEAPTDAGRPGETATEARPAGEDRLAKFVSVVLASTEDTWREQLRRAGRTYREPKLVLFTGAVESACGYAESAVGPFYCPADEKVYIDLSFCRDLKDRFGAPGDFAQAYVIAHEVGHHVQNLLGIPGKVEAGRAKAGSAESNRLSVRLELQADCLAGVWAYHADKTRRILEEGDLEEGLGAAAAIGDDRLQRQSQGHVIPDSFTHGTSEQRVRWFRRGMETGEIAACNTFQAADP